MKYKAMTNQVIRLKKEKPILVWAVTIVILALTAFAIASFFLFSVQQWSGPSGGGYGFSHQPNHQFDGSSAKSG